MTATHPSDCQLSDFLLGRLTDSVQADVESHFAACVSCPDRAATVTANDTFTELLASARTVADPVRSSAPTPTPDGAATPPAFAPTLAWQGGSAPGVNATGL